MSSTTPGGGTRIVAVSGGFEVRGDHTYQHPGEFIARVIPTDHDKQTYNDLYMDVDPAQPPQYRYKVIADRIDNVVEGTAIPGADVGSPRKLGDVVFTNRSDCECLEVEIDWGDGTISKGYTSGISGNVVPIYSKSSHTYMQEGIYLVTITVTDQNHESKNGYSTAAIDDAPIAIEKRNQTTSTAAFLDNTVVATFQDDFKYDSSTNYVAIIEWGDVNPETLKSNLTVGALVAGSNGNFSVVGSHQYLAPGQHYVRTTV